ncbi:MAG: hypothetical protein ACRDZ7_19860 [Acidimicrobiia bacterium]
MMGRRLGRALLWGILAGGGLVIGLAAGSTLASTPTDGEMLTQIGGGAGALAALLGLVLPIKPKIPR